MVTRLTLSGGGCGDKANFAGWGGVVTRLTVTKSIPIERQ